MTSPAILTFGNPRRRIARVPLIFRWRDCEDEDGIFALSYGKRVGLVHTRAGAAGVAEVYDQDGRISWVPADKPRLSWEYTTAGTRLRVLLLEQAMGNPLVRAQDFAHAAWAGALAVTPAAARGPDGLLTSSLITGGNHQQLFDFTGNGGKPVMIVARQNDAAVSKIELLDGDLGSAMSVTITWNGSAPPVVAVDVAATYTVAIYPVVPVAERHWLIRLLVSGVVAGAADQHHVLGFVPDNAHAGGSAYLYHAQVRNSAPPPSLIRSVATPLTQVTDLAYLPLNLATRALTAYVDGVELGTRLIALSGATTHRILQVSDEVNANPKLLLGAFTNGRYQFQHFTASSNVVQAMPSDAANPDLDEPVEFRGVLREDGAVRLGVSRSGAAETLTGFSSALALAPAWSAPRLYLNNGGNVGYGRFGFRNLVVADGAETPLDECRELCEVG